MKRLFTSITIIFAMITCLLASPPPLFAQSDGTTNYLLAQSDEVTNYLKMYFKDEELTVLSATRSPKPVSQTAENITVVTASDIELMNAHTLAEILNTVTGVQVTPVMGPGQTAVVQIQGSEARHVTVIVDGISFGDIGDNIAEVGMIPVQNIEKIEIIKGPASSTWGSALGGVINIITKSGTMENQGGVFSASYGSKNTEDLRAEARGKQDRFGYYLTAGRLQTDGLTAHSDLWNNNAYAKLTYDLTDKSNILLTLGYTKTARDTGQIVSYYSLDNTWETIFSTLAFESELTNDLNLSVSLDSISHSYFYETYSFSSGQLIAHDQSYDKGYGSNAKLTWKGPNQTIVLGADYENRKFKDTLITSGELNSIRQALFFNDTIVVDNIAITPGVRYDITNTNGDITNPSLGIAYNIDNSTTVRAYAAKGFSIPGIMETNGETLTYSSNPDLKMETVTSYEGGIETAALKSVWIKIAVFRNEIRSALTPTNSSVDPNKWTYVNLGRERREGLDIEIKTVPVDNVSLFGGAEFIEAKDVDTNDTITTGVPIRIYDLGLRYDDKQSIRALLQGRYIDWNDSGDGHYSAFVIDLNMVKEVYKRKNGALDVFLDGHNIFNGNQYDYSFYPNPERWYEGGLRYKF